MFLGIYPVQAGLVASLAGLAVNVTGRRSGRSPAGSTSNCSRRPYEADAGRYPLGPPPSPVRGHRDPGGARRRSPEAWPDVGVDRGPTAGRHRAGPRQVAKERPGALWVLPIGPSRRARGRSSTSPPSTDCRRSFQRDILSRRGLMSYGYDREHLVKRAARTRPHSQGCEARRSPHRTAD